MKRNDIERLYARARAGDIQAQNELAARLATGDEVDRNITESIAWYKAAAAKSSPEALYNLALMRLAGEGTEKDEHLAVENLVESADLGGIDACLMLAEACEDAELGFSFDIEKAVEFYLRAARFGSTKGINRVGEIIAHGTLPPVKVAEIMKNFRI